jgi:hypothetical protein
MIILMALIMITLASDASTVLNLSIKISELFSLGVESLTPLQGEVSPKILDRPVNFKG